MEITYWISFRGKDLLYLETDSVLYMLVLLQRSERGRTRVHFMTNVDNALRILEENNVSTCTKNFNIINTYFA